MASGVTHDGFIAQEVMRVGSNGSIGIGTSSLSGQLVAWSKWSDIQKLSETNPAVKIALDKLITVYHLSKDYGNNKT